jgi:hypothetical protein
LARWYTSTTATHCVTLRYRSAPRT